ARLLLAASSCQPTVLGGEVGAPGASHGLGSLDQRRFEPLVAGARLAALLLTGAFVITGADPGPRGKVSRAREPAHIVPYFCDHRLGGTATHARYGIQAYDLGIERVDALSDLGADAIDRLIERIDVAELLRQHKALVGAQPSAQRPLECRPLVS